MACFQLCYKTHRESLLKESWQSGKLLPQASLVPGSATQTSAGAPAATSALLHEAMRQEGNPRCRHLAFMMLQRLGGRTPSLFKELAEEAGPTGGLQHDPAVRVTVGLGGWEAPSDIHAQF